MTAKDVISILFSKPAEGRVCFRWNFLLSVPKVLRRGEKKKPYITDTLYCTKTNKNAHTEVSYISYTIYNFKHQYIATLSAPCTFFIPYFMGIHALIPWNQTAAGKLGRQTKEEPGLYVCVCAQTAPFLQLRGTCR